jgi:hypothetical protein
MGEVDQQYDRDRGAAGQDRAERRPPRVAPAPPYDDQPEHHRDRAHRHQHIGVRVAGGLQVDGRGWRRLDPAGEVDLFADLYPVVVDELGDDEERAARRQHQADRPPRRQHRRAGARRPRRAGPERPQRRFGQRQPAEEPHKEGAERPEEPGRSDAYPPGNEARYSQ